MCWNDQLLHLLSTHWLYADSRTLPVGAARCLPNPAALPHRASSRISILFSTYIRTPTSVLQHQIPPGKVKDQTLTRFIFSNLSSGICSAIALTRLRHSSACASVTLILGTAEAEADAEGLGPAMLAMVAGDGAVMLPGVGAVVGSAMPV